MSSSNPTLSINFIGIGLTAISFIGVAIGTSIIFSTYIICISSQPSIQKTLFTLTIIAFAFIEAIALFGLILAISIF